MRVIIRCDASLLIGYGHLTRMISLAEQLQNSITANIVFLMRNLSSDAIKQVMNKGFRIEVIHDTQDRFEVNEFHEVSAIESLKPSKKDILIIDHYGYTNQLLSKTKKLVGGLVLIDDFQPDRLTNEVDLLVNPNFSASNMCYPKNSNTTYLLGPTYAMLRSDFYSEKYCNYEVKRDCTKILICFGGSDVTNTTIKVLQVLGKINEPLIITAIVHPNKYYEIVNSEYVKNLRHVINIKTNVSNMAQELFNSDLAILSASTIALEAGAIGVPTVLVACEDNQQSGGEAMGQKEVSRFLGNLEDICWIEALSTIQSLRRDYHRRQCLSIKAKAFLQNPGTKEIVKYIERMDLNENQ